MCVTAIVDADVLHKVLASKKDHGGDPEFRSWIRDRHGILAWTEHGRFRREMRNNAVLRLVGEYRRSGQLKVIGGPELAKARKRIEQAPVRSNDRHILALALAGDASILCTGDKRLKDDFQNSEVLPMSGGRRRELYPIRGSTCERSEFLDRHRCRERTVR